MHGNMNIKLFQYFKLYIYPPDVFSKAILGYSTKCNSLTQQCIVISITIDTWATCFDSYAVIFRPSKNTDPINNQPY